MKRVTFVDASVLIAAARGSDQLSERALQVLTDESRVFATSEFVRLEVLPKAIHYNYRAEREFYESFFADARLWADAGSILRQAFELAVRHGLSGFDALHVAAAISVGAEELITAEKKEKPLYRVPMPRVVSIG